MRRMKSETNFIGNNEFFILNTTHILPDVYPASGNISENRVDKYR